MIYVHWDGYPSRALPILVDFLTTEGARYRINDVEYLSAYYVAWKIIHDFGIQNLKDMDDYRSIGIEVECNEWCDYTYIVKGDIITIINYNGKVLHEFKYLEEDIENVLKWCRQ